MKFKAFTLLELIIASLITGIIGFIIIYFLQDIMLVTKGQQAAKKQEEDLALFDLLLTNDLFLSDTFYFNNSQLEIIKDTTRTYYIKNDNAVTRIHTQDTSLFYLPLEDFRLNTSNKKQVLEATYNLTSSSVKAIYIDEADYLK